MEIRQEKKEKLHLSSSIDDNNIYKALLVAAWRLARCQLGHSRKMHIHYW